MQLKKPNQSSHHAHLVLAYRHTPPVEEFQRIVEANLAEVRRDYVQSAQRNLDAAISKQDGSEMDTSQLKYPRPVQVVTLDTSLVSCMYDVSIVDHAAARIPSKTKFLLFFLVVADVSGTQHITSLGQDACLNDLASAMHVRLWDVLTVLLPWTSQVSHDQGRLHI